MLYVTLTEERGDAVSPSDFRQKAMIFVKSIQRPAERKCELKDAAGNASGQLVSISEMC
jgi:hypothetical protein